MSSLRHLPNSAVKNGTNVALLLYFSFFPSFLWSLQCHQVQVPQEINTGRNAIFLWGLSLKISRYLLCNWGAFSISWILEYNLFFPVSLSLSLSPVHLSHVVMVFDFFFPPGVVRYSDIEGQRPYKLHRLCSPWLYLFHEP